MVLIDRALTASTHTSLDFFHWLHSYSPLFSGIGWSCCWSAGRAHCVSPPEYGRHTRSSSALTVAEAGSWQLKWLALSPRQGCRFGLRVESEDSPTKKKKRETVYFLTSDNEVTVEKVFNTVRGISTTGTNSVRSEKPWAMGYIFDLTSDLLQHTRAWWTVHMCCRLVQHSLALQNKNHCTTALEKERLSYKVHRRLSSP